MRHIDIGYGLSALVDDGDYDLVRNYHWHLKPSDQTLYARTLVPGGQKVYLHRMVMVPERDGLVVDHINGRGYDCRRENLRWVTIAENNANRHACEWPRIHRHPEFAGRWQYDLDGALVGDFPTAFHAALGFDRMVVSLGLDVRLCHFPMAGAGEYERVYPSLPIPL